MLREDKKQQELIEKFMSKIDIWNPEKWSFLICFWLFVGISTLMFSFPIQTWEKDYSFLFVPTVLYYTGLLFAIRIYDTSRVNNQQQSLYDIIKYMPVDIAQVEIYKFKKLFRFASKYTLVVILMQVVFAVAFYHQVSLLENILLPFAILWLFPVLSQRVLC